MKLYHFTSEQHIVRCCKHGLTLGMIPTYNEQGQRDVIKGYQWLTVNKEFSSQNWHTRGRLPYDRTAYRILINIPKHRRKISLFHWIDVCNDLCDKQMVEELNYTGHPEDWYIYKGNIKTGWFREIVDKQGKICY